MPDRPHLHELPKHIHGEFKTMARRQEAIQRRIDQLEKLKQKDIDVSEYISENPETKYMDKWIEAREAEGRFHVTGGVHNSIYAVAYQSCWPEEADHMLFQHFYTLLNTKFRWWAAGRLSHDNIILLMKRKARIINGALPNVNSNVFACAGDYGEKFIYGGSPLNKIRELYNYASSPNLRENMMITSTYSATAAVFQYCDLKVKTNGEERTTTIADLVLELWDAAPAPIVEDIIERQCAYCRNNDEDLLRKTRLPNGEVALDKEQRLLNLFRNDYDSVTKAVETFDERELIILTADIDTHRCKTCIFKYQNKAEAKKLYEFIKPRFDMAVEKIDQAEEQEGDDDIVL